MKVQCFGPKNGYRFSAHAAAISNRFRGSSYPNPAFAATYGTFWIQRWDSTDLKSEISVAFAVRFAFVGAPLAAPARETPAKMWPIRLRVRRLDVLRVPSRNKSL
jgi:hypothetical protein